MNADERSTGLAAAARCRRRQLLSLAESMAGRERIRLLDPPEAQTVMLEIQSPVGEFCAVEVVVTTARIALGEHSGWGCVLGWDAEGAVACALLDAVGGPDVDAMAAASLATEATSRRERSQALATTYVGGE
jgi:alpha-D-ribose 1-methylphosphonate 5-triphosphate synthase subunit PhnG